MRVRRKMAHNVHMKCPQSIGNIIRWMLISYSNRMLRSLHLRLNNNAVSNTWHLGRMNGVLHLIIPCFMFSCFSLSSNTHNLDRNSKFSSFLHRWGKVESKIRYPENVFIIRIIIMVSCAFGTWVRLQSVCVCLWRAGLFKPKRLQSFQKN